VIFSTRIKFAALILSVLFILISKYVIDHSSETLPQVLPLIAYSSLLIAGGVITLSLGSLLRNFVEGENHEATPLLTQVPQEQASDFLIGFVAVAYLSLIRPPLAAYVAFLPYVEWAAIALLIYMVYTMTRQPADEVYISSQTPSWKRHVQEIRRQTGRDLARVTAVMEQFVDHGVKEPLIVYLTLHLQMLGQTEEDILKTLNPLIDYRENVQRHSHFLVSTGTKRKNAVKDKEAREKLLDALLKRIDEVKLY
jgi:hypothetical protein